MSTTKALSAAFAPLEAEWLASGPPTDAEVGIDSEGWTPMSWAITKALLNDRTPAGRLAIFSQVVASLTALDEAAQRLAKTERVALRTFLQSLLQVYRQQMNEAQDEIRAASAAVNLAGIPPHAR